MILFRDSPARTTQLASTSDIPTLLMWAAITSHTRSTVRLLTFDKIILSCFRSIFMSMRRISWISQFSFKKSK